MPSALGEKIRSLRMAKKMSLEKLAEATESSKSYLWELENRDAPNPSADKLMKLAMALDVTTEFLLAGPEGSPGQAVADQAFFRKYQSLPEADKKRLRRILDAWDHE